MERQLKKGWPKGKKRGPRRPWPRIGERIRLAGRHPQAGQEATVLRLEQPWGLTVFGAFPRVRADSGREDYLFAPGEWGMVTPPPAAPEPSEGLSPRVLAQRQRRAPEKAAR